MPINKFKMNIVLKAIQNGAIGIVIEIGVILLFILAGGLVSFIWWSLIK